MISSLEFTPFTLDDFQESVLSVHCGVQSLSSGLDGLCVYKEQPLCRHVCPYVLFPLSSLSLGCWRKGSERRACDSRAGEGGGCEEVKGLRENRGHTCFHPRDSSLRGLQELQDPG